MKSFPCLGPGKLRINVGGQTWFHPASKRRLLDIAALSLSVNHVYYWNFRERVRERTTTKRKKKKTLCKRLLTLKWNITMTKDFLAGLTVQWHPLLLLEPSLINKLGLNNGTYGNLLPAPKNLGLRPDTLQGPVMVIVTISFAVISHILYRLLSHFLLL